jgi:hypothetical protein
MKKWLQWTPDPNGILGLLLGLAAILIIFFLTVATGYVLPK